MTAACGIFITDLDGTLLRDGRISDADRNAFVRLGETGVIRVIATGRSAFSLRRVLPLDFPVDYLILSTGNQVVDCRTRMSLYEGTLYPEEIQSICHILRTLNLDYMVHDVFPDNHRFRYRRHGNSNPDFDRRLHMYADVARPLRPEEALETASQFVIVVPHDGANIAAGLAQELQGVSIIRATSPLDDTSVWIEIFAAGVSKSAGIRRILTLHDLLPSRTAAIGNDHNDTDMLDLAHYAFVTETAFVDASNYVTLPVQDDTVALAVDRYLQQLPPLTATI